MNRNLWLHLLNRQSAISEPRGYGVEDCSGYVDAGMEQPEGVIFPRRKTLAERWADWLDIVDR